MTNLEILKQSIGGLSDMELVLFSQIMIWSDRYAAGEVGADGEVVIEQLMQRANEFPELGKMIAEINSAQV